MKELVKKQKEKIQELESRILAIRDIVDYRDELAYGIRGPINKLMLEKEEDKLWGKICSITYGYLWENKPERKACSRKDE